MSPNTLTRSQTEILAAVVDLIATREDAVCTDEIADRIDRNPYTIRTEMQQLTALQLLEGIPGPRGGYKPTVDAYRTLDTQDLEEVAVVPIEHDGITTDAVVESIDFRSVNDPERCRATVTARAGASSLSRGETVSIGPTPNTGLTLAGTIESLEDAGSTATFTLAIDELTTDAIENAATTTERTAADRAVPADSTAD
ncbi:TrmB family transcriptional regulator [Halopenitus sp. POP-27]|uniref:TrmB family transcriptional regulator n=1 Tax=Halopenitus sp. POP-27 TaxID=2994425 RepID=UPI002469B63B|nr:TrmB family transcriptional regulator [Halopenitus sp. POP-27]